MAVVVVPDVVLIIEVGYEQIELAVVIVVSQGYAHGSLLAAAIVDCRSRDESDFLEGTIAVVMIKKVGSGVIGNKNIDLAILIKITADNSEAIIAVVISHAGLR